MSWASGRRFLIVGTVLLVLAAIAAALVFAARYEAPSCMDGTQNQDEEGIDCGGSCAYVCTAAVEEPRVEFVRALEPAPGRTDVFAYVRNPNGDVAARGIRYAVELYDANNALMATKTGTFDLPPGAQVPVFIANAYAGATPIARAFLTFDDASLRWSRYRDTRVMPDVSGEAITLSPLPRVTAMLRNPGAEPLSDVKAVVVVTAADGTVVAASQTVLPLLPARGSAMATYTWNEPWPVPGVRAVVTPILPL